MPLYIRDDDVRALADTLASHEGLTLTEAVRVALQEKVRGIGAEREAKVAEKIRRTLEIVTEMRSLPDLRPGFTDRDLYDEEGTPIL